MDKQVNWLTNDGVLNVFFFFTFLFPKCQLLICLSDQLTHFLSFSLSFLRSFSVCLAGSTEAGCRERPGGSAGQAEEHPE